MTPNQATLSIPPAGTGQGDRLQTRLKELQNENKYTKERLRQADDDVKKVSYFNPLSLFVHNHKKVFVSTVGHQRSNTLKNQQGFNIINHNVNGSCYCRSPQ